MEAEAELSKQSAEFEKSRAALSQARDVLATSLQLWNWRPPTLTALRRELRKFGQHSETLRLSNPSGWHENELNGELVRQRGKPLKSSWTYLLERRRRPYVS